MDVVKIELMRVKNLESRNIRYSGQLGSAVSKSIWFTLKANTVVITHLLARNVHGLPVCNPRCGGHMNDSSVLLNDESQKLCYEPHVDI